MRARASRRRSSEPLIRTTDNQIDEAVGARTRHHRGWLLDAEFPPQAGIDIMTPNNKHHESAPWTRFALVVVLGMAAFMGGVLTLEAIRTSAVAMAYAACLVLMLAATFASLGRSSRKRQTPDGLQPRPKPAWHVHRTFTDPLFQGPAAFCVFVLALDLVSDLRAEPPGIGGRSVVLHSARRGRVRDLRQTRRPPDRGGPHECRHLGVPPVRACCRRLHGPERRVAAPA